MMKTTVETSLKLYSAAKIFFDTLEQHDLLDHPNVFTALDEHARSKGFMLSAEQRGVFGTRLYFERVDT